MEKKANKQQIEREAAINKLADRCFSMAAKLGLTYEEFLVVQRKSRALAIKAARLGGN